MSGKYCLVWDVGSYSVRAGLAANPIPAVWTRSAICVDSLTSMSSDMEQHTSSASNPIFGDHLTSGPIVHDGACVPVWRDSVVSWSALECLMEAVTTSRFDAPLEGRHVLICEGLDMPRSDRERWAEVLFEQRNLAAVTFAPSPLCIAVGSGHMDGLVVDVGHSGVRIACVEDGVVNRMGAVSSPVGSWWCIQQLATDININQHKKTNTVATNMDVRDMPQQLLAAQQLIHTHGRCIALPKEIPPPDHMDWPGVNGQRGHRVAVNAIAESCVQPLFDGVHPHPSMSQMITAALVGIGGSSGGASVPRDKRPSLLSKVMVAGGGAKQHGLRSRLDHIIRNAHIASSSALRSLSVRIVGPRISNTLDPVENPWSSLDPICEPSCAAFSGACSLVHLPVYQQLCTSKDEYQEYGIACVHQKSM